MMLLAKASVFNEPCQFPWGKLCAIYFYEAFWTSENSGERFVQGNRLFRSFYLVSACWIGKIFHISDI